VLVQRNLPILEGGQLLCRVIVLEDVTELRKKEKQILVQSAVIKEIHHRVKNNLQTIASLLRMQARRSPEPAVKEALTESINRITSISVVHEFLSQQGFEAIDVQKITNNILDLLQPMMLPSDFVLERKITGEEAILPPVQGTNLALVINELLLNAMEHGFEGRKSGVIGLDIKSTEAGFLIDIRDDGAGLPESFDLRKTKSLGLQIVRTLVEGDLGGEFRLESDEDGTHARLMIPRGKDKEEKSV
jgi:two-component sensor histidine kinase